MISLWIPDADRQLAKDLAKSSGGKLLFDEDEKSWLFLGAKLPAGLQKYTVKAQIAQSSKKTAVSGGQPSRIHILDVPYPERARASAAGARWNPKLKATIWTGGRLPKDLEPWASHEYSYERWREHKVNKTKPVERFGRAGFSMRLHQVDGVKSAMAAQQRGLPGFLLADEVGLGKTITAWMAAKKVPGARKALIIAPLAVVPHWRSAIGMMGDGGIEVIVINYDRLQKLFEASASTSKMIKSRKGVAKFAEAMDFDVVIVDESHKCRNPTTARSKLVAKLVMKAKFALWLSATAGQNPLELSYLAPLLCQLTGAKMSDLKEFEQWCKSEGLGVKRGSFGKWEWDGDPKDCDKMRKMLFSANTKRPAGGIRRRPEDIQGWPEINRILFPIELNGEEREAYEQSWKEFRKSMEMSPVGSQSKNALVARLRLRQKMSLLRARETAEFALELQESGQQVAVSIAFLETLGIIKEIIEKEGHEVATIHGKSISKEQERLDFQTGRKPFVLFTVEEGISLHQGEHNEIPRSCIIHDLRWSAISMSQIEGRCHRDGRFAQAYWAYGQETIEEEIAKIVVGRMDSMKRMVGDDTQTLKIIEATLQLNA